LEEILSSSDRLLGKGAYNTKVDRRLPERENCVSAGYIESDVEAAVIGRRAGVVASLRVRLGPQSGRAHL